MSFRLVQQPVVGASKCIAVHIGCVVHHLGAIGIDAIVKRVIVVIIGNAGMTVPANLAFVRQPGGRREFNQSVACFCRNTANSVKLKARKSIFTIGLMRRFFDAEVRVRFE